MKNINYLFLIICIVLLGSVKLFAQDDDEDFEDFSVVSSALQNGEPEGVAANFLYSHIADQNYIGMRLRPELSFGKFGIGLDIPVMINMADWKVDTKEYTDGIGVIRIFRYISWGVKKKDNVYVKVGELSDAFLGFGCLLNNYNNSISYEKRKLGIEFDMTFKKIYGLEMLYSDIDVHSFNLLALRPYYKPFGATSIPIIKTLEVGIGGVFDHDNTSIGADSVMYKTNNFVNDGVSGFSADAGLYLLRLKWLQFKVYTQYGHLNKITNTNLDTYINSGLFAIAYPTVDLSHVQNYKGGNGISIGTEFKFKLLGNRIRLNWKAERIWYSDYYLPQFFDFGYELNKDAKVLSLIQAKAKGGTYADLTFSVLDKIILNGSLLIPDKVGIEAPAMLKIGMDLSNIYDKLILYGTYYKGNLTSLQDAFKIDNNSMMNVRAAWKIYEIDLIKLLFIGGVDYKWSFATSKDGMFDAASYISPYFSISLPLGVNKESVPEEE